MNNSKSHETQTFAGGDACAPGASDCAAEESPFLDRDKHVDIKIGRNLPHWDQEGKIQFVTFRLADSLPKCAQEELRSVIEAFKHRNPGEWSDSQKREFRKMVSKREEELLDAGYGSCVLARPEVRRRLCECLKFRDGTDYELLAYVIMPNHVHILLRTAEGVAISAIMRTVKGFSAHEINKMLGRKGAFWMRESFDRIVRNEEHLRHYMAYIRHNPDGLRAGTYELYMG